MTAARMLRFRTDHIGEAHVTLTIFQSDNGINWAHAGSINVGRQWFDESDLPPEGLSGDFSLVDAEPDRCKAISPVEGRCAMDVDHKGREHRHPIAGGYISWW